MKHASSLCVYRIKFYQSLASSKSICLLQTQDEETDSEKLSDTQQGEREILNSQSLSESSSSSSDELIKQECVTMEGKNTFDVPCSEENSHLQPEDTKKVTDNSNIRFKLSSSCSGIV